MNYRKALDFIINEKQISISVLAKQLEVNKRWIEIILKNDEWNPCLKTILKISDLTATDTAIFLRYAGDTFQGAIGNHTIYPEDISDTLRYYRFKKELSENQLAQITGFQISSISFRESNRYCNLPTLSTLENYCKAYNISIGEFINTATNINHQILHFNSMCRTLKLNRSLSLR
ncbi:hypothetical protein SpiGrapes_2454 [Sphaerochaeta pleomorpha str. Grapes]|uniref:HTH cro/C1-type domain-containing protein n=1 Tax=Sphaerochaeta pleomorpha (strain ATCC BAA-1885 / DSM 22778 / Grapes) TaxID=158190 RepID=G8QTH6_SPHPG|nr:helix-turn-helix transcriptional regulator [Sphaerochaeta pleomorpha]AEV30217.1 hypothetical protein SpiGrapes_2454 [Sphaerochaeta pleomorpha str. Grapes]